MTSGTLITPAGTAVISGRTVLFCEKLSARNAEIAGMEFGSVVFDAKGAKVVFTVSHSTLEK